MYGRALYVAFRRQTDKSPGDSKPVTKRVRTQFFVFDRKLWNFVTWSIFSKFLEVSVVPQDVREISKLFRGTWGTGKGKGAFTHVMEVQNDVDVQLHLFFTFAVEYDEWLASRPARFSRW